MSAFGIIIDGTFCPVGFGVGTGTEAQSVSFESTAVDLVTVTNADAIHGALARIVRGDFAVCDVAGRLGKVSGAQLIDEGGAKTVVKKQGDCGPNDPSECQRIQQLFHMPSLGDLRVLHITISRENSNPCVSVKAGLIIG